MKTRCLIVTIIVTAFATGPFSLYNCFADERPTGFFVGKIQSLDVPSRMLQVKSEKSEMTFAIAPDAKITGADNKELTLADLKAGDEVTVDYTEQDGFYVAHKITVKGSPPPQPLPPVNDPIPIRSMKNTLQEYTLLTLTASTELWCGGDGVTYRFAGRGQHSGLNNISGTGTDLYTPFPTADYPSLLYRRK